ncbi:MAG: hypothetical protein RLZZ383_1135, partial [Pseudomonadota bacterium]
PPIALPIPTDGSDGGTQPANDTTDATAPGAPVEDPDATVGADDPSARDDDTAAAAPSQP